MRKILIHCLGFVLVLGVYVGIMATAEAQKISPSSRHSIDTVRSSWYVYAFDDDIDAAFEIVADLDAYSAAALSDTVEVLYAGAEDSSRVWVEGIQMDSTRIAYALRANGTTKAVAPDSFRHFERAWIDSTNSSGTNALTIREASGDATITTLIAGQHHSYIAHRFAAKNERNYITDWSVTVTTTTGSIEAQLRIYQDWADNADLGDEYTIVDSVLLPNVVGSNYQRTFPAAIQIPTYGMAVIVAKGGAINSDVVVRMSGYVE